MKLFACNTYFVAVLSLIVSTALKEVIVKVVPNLGNQLAYLNCFIVLLKVKAYMQDTCLYLSMNQSAIPVALFVRVSKKSQSYERQVSDLTRYAD
ncbi:hypothetical protein BH09BAC4_BH09BAC4_27630 [soil metagenome]